MIHLDNASMEVSDNKATVIFELSGDNLRRLQWITFREGDTKAVLEKIIHLYETLWLK